MKLLKKRVRSLLVQLYEEVELLPDDDLQQVGAVVESLYYDLYVLRFIQQANRSVKPGDSLTREEALRYLRSL
ncbi:hypothetical protein [Oscillatoria acuminata]|uniref:Uncharacterized protein n=1 Tax=Oscillatoria acuminata PCC 6304 TaxID=56110 RepID=K9TBT2_9CYAN|nr:hypothetical protein [Oscillatoria acuminata]AFY80322.1 hypothetical protein Oscil6304_0581 [Oscillatoria acuminata PCC 6304]